MNVLASWCNVLGETGRSLSCFQGLDMMSFLTPPATFEGVHQAKTSFFGRPAKGKVLIKAASFTESVTQAYSHHIIYSVKFIRVLARVLSWGMHLPKVNDLFSNETPQPQPRRNPCRMQQRKTPPPKPRRRRRRTRTRNGRMSSAQSSASAALATPLQSTRSSGFEV